MKKHHLTDEEKQLFRSQMTDVKPLHKNTPRAEPPPPNKPLIKRHASKTILKPASTSVIDICLSSSYQETVSTDSVLSFIQPSLQKKLLHALKSNQINWEKRLDLHGLKTDEAKNQLLKFLSESMNTGYRCVLIIHGKGGLGYEAPVLKNLINHWMRQIPQVLAFHSALPKHGGTGAIYVLLRREKERQN